MFKKIEVLWTDDPDDVDAMIYYKEIYINLNHISQYYQAEETNDNTLIMSNGTEYIVKSLDFLKGENNE